MAFTFNDLKAATFHNNQGFVSDWLKTCTDDYENRDTNQKWMGRLLGVAALHHSVDVANCIIDYIKPLEDRGDILNYIDLEGKAPLHYAVEGSKQTDIDQVVKVRDLKAIIGCLFSNGADPTVKSGIGLTPRQIADVHGFKVGSALLKILEDIWLNNCVSGKVDGSNEQICWHKELLHWAVENTYEDIVMCILRMNISSLIDPDQPCTTMIHPYQQIADQDLTAMQFLLGTAEGLYANTLIHFATNLGNVNMLRAFIICSGLRLNVAINKRWKQMLQADVVTEQYGQTPLSLAIPYDSCCDIVYAFADLQVGDNYVTHIDLSYTRTAFLPKELFNLHSIVNLNVSNNRLKETPFAELSANLRPGQLSDLNLSNNRLTDLPIEVFHLPNLKYLDVSDNPLTSLPDLWWLSKSLIRFNVSKTKITKLCSWKDADLNFFKRCGRLASISSTDSDCFSPTKKSDGLDNRRASHSCLLKELNVSSCSLSSFPKYLACYFPNLQLLNISNNDITLCCALNELPAFLEELDISNNNIQSEEDCATFSLSSETSCCYLHTELESLLKCTHMRHSKLSKLRILNVSNNEELQKVVLYSENLSSGFSRDLLYFPKLTKLMISNCGLLQAPLFLDKLTKLYHLDISKNNMKVPHDVCNLESLMTFIYDGLPDPIVANLDNFSSVKDKQIFLMQQNAVSAPSMKLMFVGLSGRGKTTLLNSLRFTGKVKTKPITIRERLDSESLEDSSGEIQSTIGVDLDLWCYAKDMDNAGKASTTPITFYAWDFAGQEEYSAAHQCFVTENSLYVLCWRAYDREEGINELKGWLLTIKARTKFSAVVIVGTQIDKMKFGATSKTYFTKHITSLYSDEQKYPPIKAIKFVSCAERYEGSIKDLRDTVYDIASETKLTISSQRFEQKLMDVMVPNKYLALQRRIIAEGSYYRQHKEKKGPPILSWTQLLEIGEKCGFSEEELAVAVKYLKSQGCLMHFDSLALQDYYFLDSQWLCDMFAHVISSEYNHTFVTQGGKADRSALEASLKEKFCISPRFMEPIVMLLCKFELAIPLDKTTFLIPSLLQNEELPPVISKAYSLPRSRITTLDPAYNRRHPEKSLSLSSSFKNRPRCGTEYFTAVAHTRVHKQITLDSTGECFRRVFVADHIPANFWPRLIARFLSSAGSFHAIICDNCAPDVHCENLIQAGDATIGALKCGWSYGKNYISLCLGEDALLCINSVCNLDSSPGKRRRSVSSFFNANKVEKVHVHYGDIDYEAMDVHAGFEVTIPDYIVRSHATPVSALHTSELMSAQILSRVLETTDEVFRDWFEGLSDQGIYSDKYLTHFIPCPYCYDGKNLPDPCSANQVAIQLKKGRNPVCLSVKYCLLQARTSEHIKCPNCGELTLKDLAPDLVFKDKSFEKIDPKQLKIGSRPLGEGGYGAVYKAVLLTDPPQDVALKCFVRGMGEAKTVTLEDLSQTYGDVRSEFNKLVSIEHPHVVKCIGFSVISMSFVLELAQLGSLKSIMNDYRSSGYYLCPNSLVDTVKQVSLALDYLHTKKMIAHYDIKPDNILVFQFPPVGHSCFNKSDDDFLCTFCKAGHNNSVEVKLADLGIAAFVGPGGFRRRPATPGHTAPEAIKYGGKEALIEKVDVFSLGITLYELMTLRLLPPPEVSPFDFDSDIRDGIRPPFYQEDPNYPAIIKELVVNCWAQEYAARPSAGEIVSILQSPDCLKLSNAYNTELPYSAVSAALVVTVDDQRSLWLAHSNDGQHKVIVYEFSEALSSTMFYKSKSFDVQGSIQAMCQDGVYVWMVLEDGSLKAVNVRTFTIERQINKLEARDDLVHIISLNDRAKSTTLVLGYEDGLIVIVKSCAQFAPGIEVKSFCLDVFSTLENKLSTVQLTSSQLYTIEKSHRFEVWCGCENASIEIVSLSNDAFTLRFSTHVSSADIPQDAAIVQLKSSFSTTAGHMMYALHGCSSVISCWRVREQPELNNVIKLTQLKSPVNMIMPFENTLIIADISGKVHELNLMYTHEEKDFTCKQLPSYHHPNTMIHLFCLHGKMTPQGFLSSIGNASAEKRSDYVSIGNASAKKRSDYVNIFDVRCPTALPCTILLGVRGGYNFFHAEFADPLSLYVTTWIYPNIVNTPIAN